LHNIARTIALLIFELIHNFDGHPEDLSHFLEHLVSLLGIDYFICPIVNRATDFLVHLSKIHHFLETLAYDFVNHGATLALISARDVSAD
jgi:hypothetical protein